MKLFHSETNTAKLYDITLLNFNAILVLLQFVCSVLNFIHSRHLLRFLVLKSDNLPSLIKVTVFLIYLPIRLVDRLRVVEPICAALVDSREKHLIVIRTVQLWHNILKGYIVSDDHHAPCGDHFAFLESLRFIVEQAVRVTIPEESVNLEVVVNTLDLIGLLSRRVRLHFLPSFSCWLEIKVRRGFQIVFTFTPLMDTIQFKLQTLLRSLV